VNSIPFRRSFLETGRSRLLHSGAIRLAGGALVATLAVTAGSAQAENKSDLEAQPAVRHRLLLVAKRLEATPMFESTINADFRHFIGGGIKLEYHLNDMLSFGAIGVFSASIDTALTTRVLDTLEESDPAPPPGASSGSREPSKKEFEQHLNKMPLHGAIYASVTPWYGKLAAFGKAFVNFDFYFQGGMSFASLTSQCDAAVCDDDAPGAAEVNPVNPAMPLPDDNPNDDAPLNAGFRPGLYLGGGLHVFVSDFLAIDLAVRDYAFKDNPSGADFNADLAVKDGDSRFLHHLFAGVGVSIMLPMKAKRTR
jgi:outer membrane beta-barrel protein